MQNLIQNKKYTVKLNTGETVEVVAKKRHRYTLKRGCFVDYELELNGHVIKDNIIIEII